MNPRERTLLLIVGGLLAVGAVYGAQSLYRSKSAALAEKMRYEQAELKKAQKALVDAKVREQEWRSIGRQTLSMDMTAAKGLFRNELVRVVTEAGMPVPPTDVVLSSSYRLGKNEVSVLVYNVKAEGTVEQIVRLLFELYRQPYLVRCKNVSIKPVLNKAPNPGAPAVPSGRLSLSMYVETPILPPDKKVPKVEVAELAPDKRKPEGRTFLATAEDYTSVIKRSLFEPYTPPTPVVRAPDPPKPHVPTTQPPKVDVPPPPPPDSRLVLNRILISPLVQQIVLTDPANATAEDKRVEVGDSLYGGVLIYIHATGAVSEREDKNGKTRTLHMISQPLQQGQVLSMTEHPAVWDALAKLEERLAGINRLEKSQ